MIEIDGMAELKTLEISKEEYRDLVLAKRDRDMLLDTLINNASLNYNNTCLRFSDDEISHIVKAIEPRRYGMRLAELREQNEA